MKLVGKFILVVSLWALVQCSPYDTGKYKHKTYDYYDDGKYYRPLTEGKYVPTDEGRYTYIYQQGVYPFDGAYKHLERGDSDDYIGFKIYAPRYPFIYSEIKSIISKYVSPDLLKLGVSIVEIGNDVYKIKPDKEVAMQCKVLDSKTKNSTEIVTQYPPYLNIKEGEKLGTIYNFRGSKTLSTVKDSITKKVKLEYEVHVRVVEDVSE